MFDIQCSISENMCGIVGYIGPQKAAPILLDGLSRLEYRGYDSAGMAILQNEETKILRAQGKLIQLRELAMKDLPSGSIGIGHTRWATHGRPSEVNAHPHRYGPITIVHNGIIENYSELREQLTKKGHSFSSDTDSEILSHLVAAELKNHPQTLQALRKALQKIRGSYAIALLNEKDPESIYIARQGSPLVLGFGTGENFLASDVPALLPYTKKVLFLEDGELVNLKSDSFLIEDLSGKSIHREPRLISWTLAMAEKGGYKHFMLKEIFEQPRAITDTIRGHLDSRKWAIREDGNHALFPNKSAIQQVDKIYMIACGTSWHAALIGRYYFENALKIPVIVEQASEFRYRQPLLDKKSFVIAISQSGETADTLMAVKNARLHGAKVLGVTNVVDSSLVRESDGVFYTYTGPEIGVAATKTFTAQLVALNLLATWLGRKKGVLKGSDTESFLRELLEIPSKMEHVLQQSKSIQEMAVKYAYGEDCLFIGRGPQFPIALEGALKLKEISYLHAEGYPAGELKHGPIALIEQGSPVVSLVLQDNYYEKMISNVQEVLARQASVIAIATEGDHRIAAQTQDLIYVPKMHSHLMPLLSVIPLQLLAYYIADHRGHDVDQPRNLAKSVTVE